LAHAAYRADERPAEWRLKLLAQVADVDVHDVGRAVVAVVPHMLEDLGSRHDLPRMVHKELKEPELAWAEFDLTPVTLHRVAGGIDHDARYLQHGGPLAGAPAGSAHATARGVRRTR